jgi:hypothetical protein
MVTCLAINETRHLPNELRWAGVSARASNLLLQRRHSSLKSTGSQGAEGLGLASSEGSQSVLTALDMDMRSSDELEDEHGRARTETVDYVDSGGEFSCLATACVCAPIPLYHVRRSRAALTAALSCASAAESQVSNQNEDEGGVLLDEALLNSLMQSAVNDTYGSGTGKALSGEFQGGSGSSRRGSLEGGSANSRRGSANLGSGSSRRGSNASLRPSSSSLAGIHENEAATSDGFLRVAQLELMTPNNTPKAHSDFGLAEAGAMHARRRSTSQSSATSQTSSAADLDEIMTRELLAQESNLSTMANMGSTTAILYGSMFDGATSDIASLSSSTLTLGMGSGFDRGESNVSNISTMANAGSSRTLGASGTGSVAHSSSSAIQRESVTLGDEAEAAWPLNEDDVPLPKAPTTPHPEFNNQRQPAALGQQLRGTRAMSEGSGRRSSASAELRRNSLPSSRGSNASEGGSFGAAESSPQRRSSTGTHSFSPGSAPSAVSYLPSRPSFR